MTCATRAGRVPGSSTSSSHFYEDDELSKQFYGVEDASFEVFGKSINGDRWALWRHSLDFHELVAATEAGSDRKLTVERRGSLEDLDAEIDRRRSAEPHRLFAWLPLTYQRAMLSGRGKLDDLVNTRLPDFRPTTVKQYARAELRA